MIHPPLTEVKDATAEREVPVLKNLLLTGDDTSKLFALGPPRDLAI